ncbi:Hypothetical protein R9X50_00636300 [Acrodontium crateriforme]|uniref:GST N-terminal domain-containing protein n=1 Tax=Acrodontium crateriforme TaxID=150365 RepID=A0AAQ3M9X9_9PEZI|nr:Hypothetical protein R9X50_00636300 [Acrodontium crateriforme]
MATKITLHWLEQSRSQRIFWLLEECKDVNYDVKVYKRGKDMLAPPELKQAHPLGKSPVIEVTSPAAEKPIVIGESGNITEYICDYYAQHLVPKRYHEGKENQVGGETEGWLRHRFFMHYAEGSIMPLRLMSFVFENVRDGPEVPFFVKPITRAIVSKVNAMFLDRNFKTNFDFLESQLATSPDNGEYLCGKDLMASDILMSFPLIACKDKIDTSKYPKLTAYIQRLESNEVYIRSTKKIEELSGAPFKALLGP